MTEVLFKQHWKTISLAVGFILLYELVGFLIGIQLWKKGDYLGIFLIQAIAIIGLVGLTYPLILNRQIIFYDEGISFIDKFQRKFIKWKEFDEISNVSDNLHPTILMKSPTGKVKIRLTEYSEKEKVIEFLNSKLEV